MRKRRRNLFTHPCLFPPVVVLSLIFFISVSNNSCRAADGSNIHAAGLTQLTQRSSSQIFQPVSETQEESNTLPFFPGRWFFIVCIGAAVGFLSGMFGKGGSAMTTPALQVFAGVAPFAALTSPLPATLPTTLSASFAYGGKKLVNMPLVGTITLYGVPATIAGAFASDWAGGKFLMFTTAIFIFILGISLISGAMNNTSEAQPSHASAAPPVWKTITVALVAGGLSGLLANSGGVLLGPLFIRFLRVPVKQAMATSLVCAAALAIPGMLAHWYLGHIDWQIVLALTIGAIPFSYLGARVAIFMTSVTLERAFGVMLAALGVYDFLYNVWK